MRALHRIAIAAVLLSLTLSNTVAQARDLPDMAVKTLSGTDTTLLAHAGFGFQHTALFVVGADLALTPSMLSELRYMECRLIVVGTTAEANALLNATGACGGNAESWMTAEHDAVLSAMGIGGLPALLAVDPTGGGGGREEGPPSGPTLSWVAVGEQDLVSRFDDWRFSE